MNRNTVFLLIAYLLISANPIVKLTATNDNDNDTARKSWQRLSLWQIDKKQHVEEVIFAGSKNLISAKPNNYHLRFSRPHQSMLRLERRNEVLGIHSEVPSQNQLYLNFESKSNSPLVNGYAYHQLKNLWMQTSDAAQGKYAALFDGKKSSILLQQRPRIIQQIKATKPHVISFWFKPLATLGEKRYCLYSQLYPNNQNQEQAQNDQQQDAGIQLCIYKQRLQTRLQKILLRSIRLQTSNGFIAVQKPQSATIIGATTILPKKWHFLVLYMDLATSKITIYVDGIEDINFQSTGQKIDIDQSNTTASIEIGSSFFGMIDEFNIATVKKTFAPLALAKQGMYPRLLEAYENQPTPQQNSGWVTSLVMNPYHLVYPQQYRAIRDKAYSQQPIIKDSRIHIIKNTATTSRIDFYVKTSLHSFLPEIDFDNQNSKWQKVNESLHLKKYRFLQWKALLRADPDGMYSPELYEVNLDFHMAELPLAPRELTRSACPITNVAKLCFTVKIAKKWWQRLVDNQENVDVLVHLGLRSQVYPLLLSLKNRDVDYEQDIQLNARNSINSQEVTVKIMISDEDLLRYLNANRFRKFVSRFYEQRSYFLSMSLTSDLGASSLAQEIAIQL